MSTISIEDQIREIVKPEVLLKVHNIQFPWPKGSKISAQDIVDNLWEDYPENKKAIYKLAHPIWTGLAKFPLEELQKVDIPKVLFDRDAPDYPELCTGLIYILDQTRVGYFRGTDARYVNGFFDLLAEQSAVSLFDDQSGGNGVPSEKSPFSKEAWMSRGYSFEEYLARVDWIWAPLIHSELYMSEKRSLNKGYLLRFRSEIEKYSGKKDPYAETQEEDEKNLLLFTEIIKGDPPKKEKLGRDLEISDYIWWMLRMNTAHFSIVERFGRYPYNNDLLGRDFTKEELEWWDSTNGSFHRLPEILRDPIRKDVDAGVWTPFKGVNDRFD